ncbi:hypothetical protein OH77DRAFT_589042 [Trametes cingulata]|nr:hypothetical protein OH77DRAFT_589042 [Trametes cingulata]
MPPPVLQIDRHIVAFAYDGHDYVAVAKRYTSTLLQEASAHSRNSQYTLVFAHALGSHKETWEPTISYLLDLELAAMHNGGSAKFTPMWTIDCPDHGESALMNKGTTSRVSCHAYAAAIYSLSQCNFFRDTGASHLVLVGHSAGAIAVALSNKFFRSSNALPPYSLVLIEPWMIDSGLQASFPHLGEVTAGLVASAKSRRDAWASAEEARAYFTSKKVWKTWKPEVLELYLFGLVPSPCSSRTTVCGVSLAFPKSRESEGYGDLSEGQAALTELKSICGILPTHIIFGSYPGAVPKAVRESICDATEGRVMASVTILPDVGHMAPQQSPRSVATALRNLRLDISRRESLCRL